MHGIFIYNDRSSAEHLYEINENLHFSLNILILDVAVPDVRGMIKTFSVRCTPSHYTDIYTRYVDTDILFELHAVLLKSSNIKYTLINRGVCHLE
jgi:hypothetical protein